MITGTAKQRFIINADDFGLTDSVNAGILYCCERKVVSSVSILAVGEAFETGAARLARFPETGKGVHLCLNDELPLSDPRDIPTLMENGRLCRYRTFLWRLMNRQINYREVYDEWKLQIERCLDAGIVPDHLDTHNHVHLFRGCFNAVVHLAEEYDIPAVRSLRADARDCGVRSCADAGKFILSLPWKSRVHELAVRGIACPSATRGFFRSGDLSARSLRSLLREIRPGGPVEIICHPGYGRSSDFPRYARWNYEWEKEMNALLEIIDSGNPDMSMVSQIRYADLTEHKQNAFPVVPRPISISLVIPAQNEYENINKTVKKAVHYLSRNVYSYEILVVDDASTDGTAAAAQLLLEGGKGEVLPRKAREGYGALLKAGFMRTSKDWIAYIDADYPARIDVLDEMLSYIKDYDVIIGYRVNSFSDGLMRYCYRIVYGWLVRCLFRVRASDVNFACKLFKRELVQSLALRSAGGFIDAELLIKAAARGCRIKEVPVHSLGRTAGISRMSGISNIVSMISEVAAYYRFFKREKIKVGKELR